jgi:hypothetical protein
VLRLERNGFENQQVESSLDEIVWLPHPMTIYNRYCR